MKIKSFLALAIFLFYSITAIAQLPVQNSVNITLKSNKNKSSVSPTFNLLQNAGGTFNIFGESKSPVFNSSLPFNKLAVNCSDSDLLLAPQAAPCNGVSVTSINFSNANRTIVSGTNNTVGVIYKYPNAGVAPDGTVVDAHVKVISYNNNQDTNENNLTDADLAVATSADGFDQNLQPNINQESATFVSGRNWNAQITYQINFYKTGTTTPIRLTVAAISIDNDGANTCGGLTETVTYNAGLNQILINTPANTTQVVSGNSVSPNTTTTLAGIDIDNRYANAALFVNVNQLNWTYAFATSGTCGSGASPRRLGSLNMSCQVTFDRNFATVALSGNVYNDTDGLVDNSISTVNSAAATKTNAGGLFANAIDANGYVFASVAVAADGTYSFPGIVPGSYKIQISKTKGVESSLAPAATLPDGWINTGERRNIGTGTDGTVDGSIDVTVGTTAITNVNFGIEQPPVPVSNPVTSQINPGGTNSVTVPGTTFAAADPSTGGTVASLRITGFPTNATSLTVGTTTYYPNAGAVPTAGNCPTATCSVFPPTGVPVTSNAAGNATQTVKVDPISGGVTVGIPYVAVDNAGFPSTTAATASVPFTALSISGNVLNDTNGLKDTPTGIVNGTGTNTGNPLYANLVQGGVVVQSVLIPADGTYSFTGVDVGVYNVVLTTTATSTTPSLPTGWVNTGENLGTAAGNDGTVNGILPVTLTNANVANANFGIEQPPTANNNTAASQINPGGTNIATVPSATFSGTDATAITNIRLTLFPTNATSFAVGTTTYYPAGVTLPGTCPTTVCANFPTSGGLTVVAGASGNPTSVVKVDPVDGAVTVVFNYVTVDAAGAESTGAMASVPFATVSLSGKVFDDVDGVSTGGIANRLGTNTGTTLYANLLDSTNKVVQSVLIPASGIYSFTGLNSGSYTVQLSINQGTVGNAAPVKALPNGWVNTGENIGTEIATDGNGDGLLAVVVGTTNITDANFGIEKIPVANDKTEAIQNNPGGTVSVTISPVFTGSDTAPGTVKNIRIPTFPTNATSITVDSLTFYPNTAAVPTAEDCPTTTCLAFTNRGLQVAANANGNPIPTVKVDPIDGAVTVAIRFVTIDDAGMTSSPDASAATVNIPFQLAPTAAQGEISGTLSFGGNPLRNALVVLIDTASNSKVFARTDANGNYLFDGKTVGKTYIVQPLSGKYSFSPGTSIVNLVDNALGLNFDSTAKKYHPKNDFDGDGQSDIAVYRPTGGNWYVLRSSDGQFSSFQFGADTDIPVSGDFDGDGKTDYAVFRPENGVWYIWQSKTQDLRAEQFGLATDKLVPADYDGDGKDDIAVYRNGNWYIRRSSDGAFEAKIYGAGADMPLTGDFDGDGKSDLTVYRPADGIFYTLQSSDAAPSAKRFGLATDIPLAADFDGDGRADIAQFRNGFWYMLNSTTDFEASRFGASDDELVIGDYDGDGRADTTIFRNGLWSIHNSGSGTVKNVNFGFPTDIPVK